MKTISLSDLATVAGGTGGVCFPKKGAWFPKEPNSFFASDGYPSNGACKAAVKRFDHSLMNINNDRAD